MGTASDRPTRGLLRGRDAECRRISSALASLGRDHGCVVVVEGAAGIGKSRLLDEAIMMAAQQVGAHAGRATAATGLGAVLMGPLFQAVRAGPRPVLADGDVPRADSGTDVRYWLIQEFESSLDRRARNGPVVIAIDDLQWADSGTIAAVEALSERLADLPIAWLIAFRPAEASQELMMAVDRLTDAGAQRIRLEPLSDQAVVEVVTDLVGAPPDAEMAALTAGVGGVPFWLTELVNALREEDRIDHVAGQATVRPGNLPQRIWNTTLDRLDRLTPAARAVVSVAAVLGRQAQFDAVKQMMDVTAAELLMPVEELLRSGLVAVDETGLLTFRHDLLREGVLSTLSASARRALERQAVDALIAGGAAPVEVAFRLAESASPGDTEAIDIVSRAMQALRGTDPAAAADLGQLILRITVPDDPRRASLVADTAILLHAAGRVTEAVHFADTALSELPSAGVEAQVRLGIAGMFTLSADVRADANRRALALDGLEAADRGRHAASLIHNLLAAGRHHEVQQTFGATAEAIRAGADDHTVFALALAHAGVSYTEGRFSTSLELVENAIRRAPRASDDARLRLAQQWRSEILGVLDRFDEATRISDSGLVEAQRECQAWAIRLWEQWRGRQMCLLGNFDDALAMLEGTFAPVSAPAAFGGNDASALSALAGAALRLADSSMIKRCDDLAARILRDATPEQSRHAGWVLAQSAMSRGDVAQAHADVLRISATVAPDDQVLPSFPTDVTDAPRLVRIARAADDPELAARAVGLAEQRAALNPEVASIVGASVHARGLLTDDLSALSAAVAAFERSPRRPALASALEDAGACAARQGESDDAVGLLGQALDLAVTMNCRGDADRLRKRLRQLGVRRRPASGDRPTRGWGALTPSEIAVVRAITSGMTNREAAETLFLSPHTVGSHLRHVFTKLDINSRVELARIATEHAT